MHANVETLVIIWQKVSFGLNFRWHTYGESWQAIAFVTYLTEYSACSFDPCIILFPLFTHSFTPVSCHFLGLICTITIFASECFVIKQNLSLNTSQIQIFSNIKKMWNSANGLRKKMWCTFFKVFFLFEYIYHWTHIETTCWQFQWKYWSHQQRNKIISSHSWERKKDIRVYKSIHMKYLFMLICFVSHDFYQKNQTRKNTKRIRTKSPNPWA